MLLISIVDDIETDAASLSEMVQRHFSQQSCFVCTYRSGNEFIRNPESSDIVLMNIEMNGLNGLETARIMRKLGMNAALIFTASSAEPAIHGYEVDAIDFLVKPVSQSALDFALNKAQTHLTEKSATTLALKLPNGTASVSANEISYVEVFDHNLVYHTVRGEYNVRGRLSDVYARLDQEHFILCNRSFIANLRYVTSIHSEYLMVGTNKISISKSHRKEILSRFASYLENNQ